VEELINCHLSVLWTSTRRRQGEQLTRPCSESEMGRGQYSGKQMIIRNIADDILATEMQEARSVRARLARRVAEKAARKLEQQSEKQVGV